MTTVAASQAPKLQFFNPATGVPLAGGLLFTYAAGTTTKQATYSNPDTLTPNTNPIILDATGSCVCFLDVTLQYEFTLSPPGDTDPPTNPIYSVDQLGYQDIILGLAPIASPAFTGTPTAPTPAAGDNSTKLATTAFVESALTPYALIASPAFTGTPTAPTPAAGDNSTKLATTAFVDAALGGSATTSNMQVFTSNGTFNVPTLVTSVRIHAWGAGGGGGGSSSANSAASGGGGGGASDGWVTVTPAQVLTITIGTAGSGGTGSGNGTAGTTTTVAGTGVNVIAHGGGGGIGSSNYGASPGGAGGTASGGTLNLTGGSGGDGYTFGAGFGLGGSGGGTFGAPSSQVAGVSPGGGGGGGGSGASGNNGASGLVVIEWL